MRLRKPRERPLRLPSRVFHVKHSEIATLQFRNFMNRTRGGEEREGDFAGSNTKNRTSPQGGGSCGLVLFAAIARRGVLRRPVKQREEELRSGSASLELRAFRDVSLRLLLFGAAPFRRKLSYGNSLASARGNLRKLAYAYKSSIIAERGSSASCQLSHSSATTRRGMRPALCGRPRFALSRVLCCICLRRLAFAFSSQAALRSSHPGPHGRLRRLVPAFPTPGSSGRPRPASPAGRRPPQEWGRRRTGTP